MLLKLSGLVGTKLIVLEASSYVLVPITSMGEPPKVF